VDEDLLDLGPEALTVDWTVEYRAMIHEVFAPGMHNRAYYHRYTDDNVDLCDVLSSFSYGAKVKVGRTQSDHGTSPFANCHVIVCYIRGEGPRYWETCQLQ
jgi:hypothetical protein